MQIAALNDEYEFIIVSSGAIAAAKQFVKLESKRKEIVVKQALASIGQPHLMRIFHENFSDLGLLLRSVYCPILILRKSNQSQYKYNQCLSRK
jgi:glutamate 5-kinase